MAHWKICTTGGGTKLRLEVLNTDTGVVCVCGTVEQEPHALEAVLEWIVLRGEPSYFDEHALSRVGVAVDASRRPVDSEGAPVYENLHAAGATLAGAVPWREGSGNGLSLASGYAAASAILEAP